MLFAADDDVQQCLARLDQWENPSLSIKGGALIGMGLPVGPLVAQTLQAVETAWVEEDFPEAERQTALARQAVNMALLAIKKA